jgi:hypothetical protein
VNIKVWQKFEIVVKARNTYANPYVDVDVWVDLVGPGFAKRVYGFWDGENVFRIRVTATCPGEWSYRTASNQVDPGLNDDEGGFTAEAWSEAEKNENPCRRGMVVATENGHGFMYADGTPVYILADTQWPLFTYRFPWHDDEETRTTGPDMGFKDVIRFRKSQGFNAVATISCFPGWQNDGLPSFIAVDEEKGLFLRGGWPTPGVNATTGRKSIKDMHNEGGRPFSFPGKVPGYEEVFPDIERPNPLYFSYLDRKMDWLNENGFTVFMETVRRDCSTVWKEFYPWPDSYSRYIHYMYSRYQTNNCLFSPIHLDSTGISIPAREYSDAANRELELYGPPPFGTLCGTNAHGTTLANYGHTDEARWLTFHQLGNFAREHDHYWYLTEIFHKDPPVPALNGEPYYPGDKNGNGPDGIQVPGDIPEADRRCRSGLYGNFLSGGLAGFFYGAQGMWGGDIEPEARFRVWDALDYESGNQIRHITSFMSVVEGGPSELIPNSELVTPNKSGEPLGYRGWAYCAHTADFSTLLLYFEKDCPRASVRGLPYGSAYRLRWFDPRSGAWVDDAEHPVIKANDINRIELPDFPSLDDWGLCLEMEEST